MNGRRPQPLALVLSLLTALISIGAMIGSLPGEQLDGAAGDALGLIGLCAAGCLWVGWWGRQHETMRFGLLVSSGIWAALALVQLEEVWPRTEALLGVHNVPAAYGSLISPAVAGGIAAMAWAAWLIEGRGPDYGHPV